jgi:transcription antitermination factor NusG
MGRRGTGEANWFAIQTNPQNEKKAAGELRRAGFRVYVPKRFDTVRNRRTHVDTVKARPLLIGYLFVRFPDAMYDDMGRPHFGIIRSCQGVKAFVRCINDEGEWVPFPIPDKDITDFIRRQRRREFGRPAVPNKRRRMAELREVYKEGDHVRITDGPFAGFLAALQRLNDNETMKVTFNVFGRETEVTVGVDQVRIDVQSEAA